MAQGKTTKRIIFGFSSEMHPFESFESEPFESLGLGRA